MKNKITSRKKIIVFISHSSKDEQKAKLVVNLVMAAFNITRSRIRCTSIHGCKLPAGVASDNQLRNEIVTSPVFISLITSASIKATYPNLEMGVRWGSKKQIIMLISSRLGTSLLTGPLKNMHALNFSMKEDVFQFVEELSNALKLTPEQPSVYNNIVDELVKSSLKK